MLAAGFAAVSGPVHAVAVGVTAVIVGGLEQVFITNLLVPAVPILQVVALFIGLYAAVHAMAVHHGEESAALLLVKPVTLLIGVEGLLVALGNWASLSHGGGITL